LRKTQPAKFGGEILFHRGSSLKGKFATRSNEERRWLNLKRLAGILAMPGARRTQRRRSETNE
jgi:hypothetical protein